LGLQSRKAQKEQEKGGSQHLCWLQDAKIRPFALYCAPVFLQIGLYKKADKTLPSPLTDQLRSRLLPKADELPQADYGPTTWMA